jgi:ABC-type transport system substrate-binding protein
LPALGALLLGPLACQDRLSAPMPSDAPNDAAPQRGGTLRTATLGDIRGLDPHNMGDGIAPQLVQLMFAGLVDYDRNGKVSPDLAERLDRSEDGKSYFVTLRPDVRFHDGNVLGARDIERSFRRALSPRTPNASKSFFFGIRGAEAFATGKATTIEGIEVRGERTLAFHLKEPDATFPAMLTMHTARPVCPSMGETYRAESEPCGAGPFRFNRWLHGQNVRLVRFDGYYRPGEPYLDAVELSLGVSAISQRLKFERGELDLLRDFVHADLVRFLADPRWRPYGTYDAETQMAGESMNTELAPMNNVELRRAIAAAVNRDEYRMVKPTMITPLTQPVPQGVKGHNPNLRCQGFDVEQALEHMRRAGYAFDPATGRGGYPHAIPYVAYSGGITEYTSQLLAQQLARIGIRIDIRLVSYAAWLAITQRRGRAVFAYQGWRLDYSDPSDFTEALFHSKGIDDEGSNNTAFYANPTLDAKMDAARRETDEAARARMYDEIQQIICDDAPWAFTYAVRFYNQRQPYVRNYVPSPMWINDVRQAWLDNNGSSRSGKSALLSPARTLPKDGR